ncbi:MAG: acetolactate synthase [Opitutaceae bacterium]
MDSIPITAQAPRHEPVKQFSVFAENKLGRLKQFVDLLGSHHIHVIALSTMETTDSAIVRVIVDDPDGARALFLEHGFPYNESDLLAVEIDSEADLKPVLTTLMAAEVNVHYLYPFISRPRAKAALAVNVEDIDLAAQALRQAGLRVLTQDDISR